MAQGRLTVAAAGGSAWVPWRTVAGAGTQGQRLPAMALGLGLGLDMVAGGTQGGAARSLLASSGREGPAARLGGVTVALTVVSTTARRMRMPGLLVVVPAS